MSLFVYPDLPQTGLANMLFVWARARVACDTLNAAMIPPQWFKPFRVGPLLRREKSFRYYLQDFRPSNFSPWKKIRLLTFAVKFSEEEIKNFYLEYTNINQDCVVIIEGNKEHFYPILSKRDLIYQSLIDISSDMVKNSFEKMKQENYIGVHVRRGDFKIVNQMIPIDWYVKTCRFTRHLVGESVAIKIFSDASKSELKDLLNLPNTTLAEGNPALLDIFLLSNSKILIGTSMSTFSLWASYLGGCTTIWSPLSPGVYGYGLHTNQHIVSDWNGHYDLNKRMTF